jgi:hypothetical protein
MKIIRYNKIYQVYCGQSAFKDVLSIVNVLTVDDLEFIAEATSYKTFQANVQTSLDRFSFRYPLKKVCHVLADGVFTRKRDKTVTLSRRGSSFNSRLSRMINNYALAERLGIECHLKNKLLENENADNQAKLLGL